MNWLKEYFEGIEMDEVEVVDKTSFKGEVIYQGHYFLGDGLYREFKIKVEHEFGGV